MRKNFIFLFSGIIFFVFLFCFQVRAEEGQDIRSKLAQLALAGEWEQVSAEISKMDPKNRQPQDDLLLGYASMDRKDWVKAWQCFSALDKSGQKQALADWADNLCKANPNSAMALVFKGDALARTGRYNDAVSALNRAVEIDPKIALAYDLRGLIMITEGRLAEGARDLDKALEFNPQMANPAYERGMVDLVSGYFDGAVTRFTELLQNEPKFFLARNARGAAYFLQAEYDLALKDFDQALLDNPDLQSARNNKIFVGMVRAKGLLSSDLCAAANISPKGVLGSMIIAIGKGPDHTDEATGIALETLAKQYPNKKIAIWDNPSVAIQDTLKGKIGVLAMDTDNRRYDVAGTIRAINAGRIDTVVLPYGYAATRTPTEVMAKMYKEAPAANGAIKGIISVNPQLGAGLGNGRLKELAVLTAGVNPNVSVSWNTQADKKMGEVAQQISTLPNFKLNVATNPYAMYACAPISKFKEGGVIECREPFRGWGGAVDTFNGLPDLAKFKYREPTAKPEIQAANTKGAAALDVIARPYHYEKLVDNMDNLIGLAGAIQPKSETPSTPGPLETQSPIDSYLANYGGSIRSRIYADKTFGLSSFSPPCDKQGRPLNTDPLAAANWRPLSRDEAIDRLQWEMAHQTDIKGEPNQYFKSLFKGVSGKNWWNGFADLQYKDPALSQITKMPEGEMKEFTFRNRPPVISTIGDFLNGNIPITKQEDAYYREYYQTEQFRKTSGQEVGFRKWLDANVESKAETAGFTSPFKNMGASSFGKERLADVWYQKVDSSMPDAKIVRDTLRQARQTGATDVSLVYSPDTLPFSQTLAKQLKTQGLNVNLIQDERLSPTRIVSAGMADATKNIYNSSIVLAVDKISHPGKDGLVCSSCEMPTLFTTYSKGNRDYAVGTLPGLLAPQLSTVPSSPQSSAKGVYLKLGSSDMDITTAKTTDLSFLQGEKTTIAKAAPAYEGEPDVSYPFLIFNASSVNPALTGVEK